MNWDQRPLYSFFESYAESQLGEGGQNASNNCVIASFCTAVRVEGGPEIEPDDIVDEMYGPTYHGYTDYGVSERAIRERWPACPPITYGSPNDTLATIDLYAQNGYPILCSFWCDHQANIVRGTRLGKHVSPVVGHVDGTVYILNVWRDDVVSISESDFADVTSGDVGQLAIFMKDAHTASAQQEAQKMKLNSPVVAGFGTPSGRGYTMVCADGGVFPFGDAKGLGSAGGVPLNSPCVSAAPTPDGGGYWLFMADGGVFPYGNAPGIGSLAGGPEEGRAPEAEPNVHNS